MNEIRQRAKDEAKSSTRVVVNLVIVLEHYWLKPNKALISRKDMIGVVWVPPGINLYVHFCLPTSSQLTTLPISSKILDKFPVADLGTDL